ncbi:unnamed protein product [Parascedosporium putredinis]|uniref:DUF7907 domain-containing protein n=1 Tax=Parascedosporium putredinis TaxID=1442378 RepID=A0A9P1M9Q9_9PEZI|nr:unnamed protein product [Parascedosporium putredinis]CAI7992518.1 unnamed protein product [Parascedosporium putredinis]
MYLQSSVALSLLASLAAAQAQTPGANVVGSVGPAPRLAVLAIPAPISIKPAGSSSAAYLDDGAGAGQFNVVDGQLVFNTGGTPLYMHVENPTDKTQRALETWFEATPGTYGKFAFQGDTLTWSVSDIKRQNEAAWYVCGEQKVYINTGAYLYQTPAGCADQTIHSYGVPRRICSR